MPSKLICLAAAAFVTAGSAVMSFPMAPLYGTATGLVAGAAGAKFIPWPLHFDPVHWLVASLYTPTSLVAAAVTFSTIVLLWFIKFPMVRLKHIVPFASLIPYVMTLRARYEKKQMNIYTAVDHVLARLNVICLFIRSETNSIVDQVAEFMSSYFVAVKLGAYAYGYFLDKDSMIDTEVALALASIDRTTSEQEAITREMHETNVRNLADSYKSLLKNRKAHTTFVAPYEPDHYKEHISKHRKLRHVYHDETLKSV